MDKQSDKEKCMQLSDGVISSLEEQTDVFTLMLLDDL